MNDKQVTINTYNQKAVELAEYFNGMGSRRADIKKAFSLIGNSNPRVIEIGCGNGRDAIEITKLTNNYLGTDVSEAMIELAKANCPQAKFEVADLEDYDLPANTDILFAFASLLHSDKENVKQFLHRSHPKLSDEGVIYISLKYSDYKGEMKHDQFGDRMFYYYSPEDIRALAQGKFKSVYEDTQQIGNTKWFTMALRKI